MVVDGGDAAEESLPLAGRGGRAAKGGGAAVALANGPAANYESWMGGAGDC